MKVSKNKKVYWTTDDVTDLCKLIDGGYDVNTMERHFKGRFTVKQISNKCSALCKIELASEKGTQNKRPAHAVCKFIY